MSPNQVIGATSILEYSKRMRVCGVRALLHVNIVAVTYRSVTLSGHGVHGGQQPARASDISEFGEEITRINPKKQNGSCTPSARSLLAEL